MVVFSLLLGIVRNLSAFSAWRGVFESGVVVAQAQENIGAAEPRAVCTRGCGGGRRASGVGQQAGRPVGSTGGDWCARGRAAGWRAGERRALAASGGWAGCVHRCLSVGLEISICKAHLFVCE